MFVRRFLYIYSIRVSACEKNMPSAKLNLREWSLLPSVEILWLSETSDDLSPADLESNEIVNEHVSPSSFLPSILHSPSIRLYQLAKFLIGTPSRCACLYVPPLPPFRRGIPTPWNRLTRWTFYVWYLPRARLGSGFIESYINAPGAWKSERGRKAWAHAFSRIDWLGIFEI